VRFFVARGGGSMPDHTWHRASPFSIGQPPGRRARDHAPRNPQRPPGSGGRARAARSTAERGAARRGLVLDRRRRMGEGSAAGVPWGDGRGTGDVGRLEGERLPTGLHTLRRVRPPSAAHTSLLRPRAMAWAEAPNRTLLGTHEPGPSVAGRPRAADGGASCGSPRPG